MRAESLIRWGIPMGRAAVALLLLPLALPAQEPVPEREIAAALLPLPLPLRAGAGVVRLGADGAPRTLRAGTNGMICLTDVPGDTIFDVGCYHERFIPAIYRRRALHHSGLSDSMVTIQLGREIQAGQLLVRPWLPTAGYRMLGPSSGYDGASNTTTDAIDRWQSIHQPFATASQMGVAEAEDGIQPYLMSSGTYWAHVMIMEHPLRY